MAGVTKASAASQVLIRSQVWSGQLKDVLLDELQSQNYVDWISFPDGETLNIPSIGELDVLDYEEDSAVEYTSLATGNFQFSITEYLSSATYITAKMRQDSFAAARVEASFVPKQKRAIDVRVEGDTMRQGQPGTPNGQIASDLNLYNGAAHRWVASDTQNGVQTIGLADFAKARHSLKRAMVPDTNLIAVVDPSVEFHLNTLSDTLNVQYNPMWEGIVSTGIATGMRFSRNIYGFDVYVSNYLYSTTAAETINSKSAPVGSVANLFFSAAGDLKPFIGAWRQMPKVDAEWNKDRQREEYVTTCRYGIKLYRPENFITVLSGQNVVSY